MYCVYVYLATSAPTGSALSLISLFTQLLYLPPFLSFNDSFFNIFSFIPFQAQQAKAAQLAAQQLQQAQSQHVAQQVRKLSFFIRCIYTLEYITI